MILLKYDPCYIFILDHMCTLFTYRYIVISTHECNTSVLCKQRSLPFKKISTSKQRALWQQVHVLSSEEHHNVFSWNGSLKRGVVKRKYHCTVKPVMRRYLNKHPYMTGVPLSQVHFNVKVHFGSQKMPFKHPDRCPLITGFTVKCLQLQQNLSSRDTLMRGHPVTRGRFLRNGVLSSNLKEPVMKGHLSGRDTSCGRCPLKTGFTVISLPLYMIVLTSIK